MPSILSLFRSFGSAGALHNARTELELSYEHQVQAAVVARRVGTIDAVAARRTATSEVGASSTALTVASAA